MTDPFIAPPPLLIRGILFCTLEYFALNWKHLSLHPITNNLYNEFSGSCLPFIWKPRYINRKYDRRYGQRQADRTIS